ncbi:MAG: HupE/UreJ family protein [Myxococcales bacterium]|nr:HupE/UreJ family protein [Myxococcales bacterium]MBL0196285.1 HupE/UreJ family protein [Myxococcales bacterium]
MTRARLVALVGWFGALLAFSLAFAFAFPSPAWAHKPSDAYLVVAARGAEVSVRLDLALRDLDDELGLDRDGDGELTWAEARAAAPAAASAAWTAIELRAGASGAATGELSVECTPVADEPPAIARHSDGAYLVLQRRLTCGATPRALVLRYGLFFARDPQHRAVVRVDAGGASRSLVLRTDAREATVDLTDPAPARRAFLAMVREGAAHIAQGYDHVLFLLALLLPAVLVRRRGRRRFAPRARFRPAALDVLRVVTAFTVAHSVTLSLAALDLVVLPSRLVESVIAASVVAAAMNNLFPLLREGRWLATFALGLMHGFGFAATLHDLDLGRGALVVSLLGFNLGVELGQLGLVAAFLPLAFVARRTWFYRWLVLKGGSVLIAALALVWLAERALAVRLLP